MAVSPGDPEKLALVEARCPTFSWAAVDGAESYELAVYAVEPRGAGAELVLSETLNGGVTVWTPPLDRCLERSGRYAWSVRAKVPDGLTEWSAAAFFQVAAGTSEAELRQIVEAVRRFVAAEAAGSGLAQADDEPPPEGAVAVGSRATYPAGAGTSLLVEDGHIAVRRDGLGFVQLDTRNNLAAPAVYCDDLTDTGRMLLRVGSIRRLYICATDGVTPGWKYRDLP